MRHHIFTQADQYPVALLLKPTAFDKTTVERCYVQPLSNLGLKEDVIAVTLEQGEKGKPSAKEAGQYLAVLLPSLMALGVQVLYVTDSTYFKLLTKQSKAEPHAGYRLPCAIKGCEHLYVVLGINYQQLIYNPDLQGKLTTSLQVIAHHFAGTYQDPGSTIIHFAEYPTTYSQIQSWLEKLHGYPELACDTETYSLKFWQAGIGTIGFSWDQHNGIAFPIDYSPIDGQRTDNKELKKLLRQFFEDYTGKLVFHNAAYDLKVLIYELWMKDALDMEGMLHGLDVLTRNLDDTKIVAYLAYNSTAGNVLGLKPLAHEFAGNWANDDIHDISKIPLPELLQYNLVDCLSTAYIKQRDYPLMVQDQQEALYKGLMMDSLKAIIHMELCGMPIDMKRVKEVKAILETEQASHLKVLETSPTIQRFNLRLQTRTMEMANAKLKTKQHPLSKFADVVFNPNSGPQMQDLFYEMLGLPVLDLTDSKQPATGADTLEKLVNHTQDPDTKAILNALIGYGKINKILTSFIPAFEQAFLKPDGHYYLHGSFNLGGTVSGRLSSSDPNLQNLPAGSTYGKLIKSCFLAIKGWLFCGADFSSLEDYISALTTKDPNKLRVYTEGYDGHCLRAFSYFRDQLQDIRQAENQDRCFKVKTKNTTLWLKSGDFIITPDGIRLPVEEYFDTYQRL